MGFSNYEYLSDDGNTYQSAFDDAQAAPGAGDLTPALGSEPTFPALFVPRYMIASTVIAGEKFTAFVACNPNHPSWVFGPGSTLTIALNSYVVTGCVGERRLPPNS